MPIYDYKCKKCEKVQERIESINSSKSNPICECGGETEKCVSNINFKLTGNDWYKGGFNGKGEH